MATEVLNFWEIVIKKPRIENYKPVIVDYKPKFQMKLMIVIYKPRFVNLLCIWHV